ncbi:MAG: hypothetical protein SOW25_08335 [Helicobacter sp.]|nr:hypothetical protein [Helicobacter sp.]
MTKIIHCVIARLAKLPHSVIARRLVAEAIHAVATRPHLQIHNTLSSAKTSINCHSFFKML